MKTRKRIFVLAITVCAIFTTVFSCAAGEIKFTAAEENLICRFVDAACGEDAPLAAKIGVANVVLKRLADSNFPDTVTAVIFEGEFECVKNGELNKAFSASAAVSAYDALRIALAGHDPTGGAIYFAEKGEGANEISISFEAGRLVFGK
ncbi:MAG: cell wall hydrolase [Clostridia bacterium]|nr:cell wall hydrolase [Clostridia bacterium]